MPTDSPSARGDGYTDIVEQTVENDAGYTDDARERFYIPN